MIFEVKKDKFYRDGKETKIEKINMSFMGFPLEAGTHHIKLTFTAPLFQKYARYLAGYHGKTKSRRL